MATPLPERDQLTPDQRRRLGAVYQLILSWRRENNTQKTGQAGQHPQTVAPTNESQTRAATQISEA
jgi:hypothetical protein